MNRISLILLFFGLVYCAEAQSIKLVCDSSSSQIMYAAAVLEQSLVKQGYSLTKGKADHTVSLLIKDDLGDEAFQVVPGHEA